MRGRFRISKCIKHTPAVLPQETMPQINAALWVRLELEVGLCAQGHELEPDGWPAEKMSPWHVNFRFLLVVGSGF